ncbi:spermidine synthase [Streptomyces sp. SID3343]|uniref:spermidine synthase n=1 Tax=Streptomyces sp. SID3343 TaxID=2690260 RepID=UPI00136B35FC|nr:spermidine synthase [Streptomyces sp. SID3343]MYW01292.1 spermidine synthase [Streptomyces sp. SID3343]
MHAIDTTTGTDEIERVPAADGELVLRRAGEHYEIISNGCFLMDTRAGESERLLVRTAFAALDELPSLRILVGGLGVGFTLREALTEPRVEHVCVVEREAHVVRWGRGPLARFSANALDDPRVSVVTSDLVAWIRSPDTTQRFHALCLDIDNGPDWTVTDGNASLYDDAGLDALRARLLPGGVLTVWSATASPAFADRLRGRFARVTVHQVPVPRGEPDVVFVART